jgi:hypothetical protein
MNIAGYCTNCTHSPARCSALAVLFLKQTLHRYRPKKKREERQPYSYTTVHPTSYCERGRRVVTTWRLLMRMAKTYTHTQKKLGQHLIKKRDDEEEDPSFTSLSRQKGGFQPSGGTILQMPAFSASGRMRSINLRGSIHSLAVG